MGFLGFEINKSGRVSQMENQMGEIQKKLKEYQKLRPSLDYYYDGFGGHRGSGNLSVSGYGTYAGYVPNYHVGKQHFESLARQSDIFMTIINALRNKIFRRGFKIKKIKQDADENQLKKLRSILKKINQNDQTLKEVLKLKEEDLNIYDDGYLISVKDYVFGLNGEIINSDTKEIIRASPNVMSIIADSEGRMGYNLEGKKVYVSPTDRTLLISEDEAKTKGFKDMNGLQLQPAHHRGISFYTKGTKDIYYIEGEVRHSSKHNPSLLYGLSPLFSIWMKMITLIEQDRYLLLNYQKGRPPRGLLAVPTTNFVSTQKAWESLKAEARKDPHSINPFLYENKDSRGKLEWIEFMKPLGDMQFIETRNEMRRQIGARYGVMPLFSGDLSQSGGLNNEGLQITVTNQAVEEGQKLYNDKVLPWILKQFNITDYALVLEEPEEKDEVIEEKLMGIKIDNAVKMSQIGFDVSYDKESEEFNFSEEAIRQTESAGLFGGPGETQLEGIDKIENIDKEFMDILNMSRKNDIRDSVYDLIVQDMEELKKEGIDLEIKKEDLDEFISKQLFDRKFEGLSKARSDQIKKIILSGTLEKSSVTDMIKKITNLGIKKEQAELITRTETSILRNSVREFNIRKATGFDEFKFQWIGPSDNRTSDISKEIKRKSKKGLPLEELKELVRKTSESFGFKPDRDWFSHPNQRHFFRRMI